MPRKRAADADPTGRAGGGGNGCHSTFTGTGALAAAVIVTAMLTGGGTLTVTARRRRRGNGCGSVYYRQGHDGRNGQWVAATDKFIGTERHRRVKYAKTEAEAVELLAQMQVEIGPN